MRVFAELQIGYKKPLSTFRFDAIMLGAVQWAEAGLTLREQTRLFP